MEEIKIFGFLFLGLGFVVFCVCFGVSCTAYGPNISERWALDLEQARIETTMKQKCLTDKFYCNPSAYSIDIKEGRQK